MELMYGNTMSSKEIADMTGKQHPHVMRDIRNMEQNLANPDLDSLWKLGTQADSQGKRRPVYHLTKKGSLMLATKYNDNIRLKLIDRWEELEKQSMLPNTKQLAQMVIAAEEEKERLQLENSRKDETIKLQAPKVEYHDKVLQSTGTYNTNQIAKELGMSARSLNKRLNELRVQYKQGGTWLLYQKYQSKGYTKTRTYTYNDQYGIESTAMQTVWTETGRKFVHSLLQESDVA
jgi:phage antirepressor YoqD-like protein/predicted transcriptional regulator